MTGLYDKILNEAAIKRGANAEARADKGAFERTLAAAERVARYVDPGSLVGDECSRCNGWGTFRNGERCDRCDGTGDRERAWVTQDAAEAERRREARQAAEAALANAEDDTEALIRSFEQSEEQGYVFSVVTGEPVEPDHPDSPLRRAGLI